MIGIGSQETAKPPTSSAHFFVTHRTDGIAGESNPYSSVENTMNQKQNEIEIALQEFISRQFPVVGQKPVRPQDSLVGLGIVDSLGVLEIVTFIETELGVALFDEELMPENFESIQTISNLVCSHLSPEAAT